MRYCLYALLLAPMIAAAAGCKRGGADGASADRDSGDKTSPSAQLAGPVADNSRCHVCHINYEEEELAVTHAQANVGCEKCHGESDDHCGDEDNITPPDIMYAKAKINPACVKCHSQIANDEDHKPVLAGTAKEEHCTDCHGEHRLAYRSQRWDKETGKPIDGNTR